MKKLMSVVVSKEAFNVASVHMLAAILEDVWK